MFFVYFPIKSAITKYAKFPSNIKIYHTINHHVHPKTIYINFYDA